MLKRVGKEPIKMCADEKLVVVDLAHYLVDSQPSYCWIPLACSLKTDFNLLSIIKRDIVCIMIDVASSIFLETDFLITQTTLLSKYNFSAHNRTNFYQGWSNHVATSLVGTIKTNVDSSIEHAQRRDTI